MLHLFHSNRLDVLLDRLLADTAAGASDDVFTPETVITQSQGMARWVAQGMAERNGVAANLDFCLPARFLWRVFASQAAQVPPVSGFDRDALTWRLLAVLPSLVDDARFAVLNRYLARDPRPLRLYQLSRRLADVYDQYLVYRPDWILAWEAGEPADDDWQGWLWRAVLEHHDGPAVHRARLLEDFHTRATALDATGLPGRVNVFGLTALPPAMLSIMQSIAAVCSVRFYLLNPCADYWGDIQSETAIARLRARRQRGQRIEDPDHRSSGHPLLASLGRQGRDFIDALYELEPASDETGFIDPGDANLLARLQSDILHLRDPAQTPMNAPADDDRSIQLHVCHGPLREVEVLHDQLRALFDTDPGLAPRDVVVMTPALTDYAPFIEAVFGAAEGDRFIPWTLADLSREGDHALARALLWLLELPTARITASEVLDLLQVPELARRFALEGSDPERLRQWIVEAGIRWGLDAGHRHDLALPPEPLHTWAFGLERLLVGYASAPVAATTVLEVAPYPYIEGQAATDVGGLCALVHTLAEWRGRLASPRTPLQWQGVLNDLLAACFADPDGGSDTLATIRAQVAAWVEDTRHGGLDGPLERGVVAAELAARLAEASANQRFLTGQVTCCALMPMRALPFKVVCLLGMNDTVFPRRERPPSFDRMPENPRRGDRSRREDDRYLFLEAILSARDILYLSYTGLSPRDDARLNPSVVVNELLDVLDRGHGSEASPPSARITTVHPLQPFSRRYFDNSDPRLFSYAAQWLPAARATLRERGASPPFCPDALSAEPVDAASLLSLERFFANPARGFLNERLNLRLPREAEVQQDHEPFALDALAGYAVRSRLLEGMIEGGNGERIAHRLNAEGLLPQSSFGPLVLAPLRQEAESLATLIRELNIERPPLALDLDIDGFTLNGRLEQRVADGVLRYRAGRLRPVDEIGLWLAHLALNAAPPTDSGRHSRFVTARGALRFEPLEPATALALLADWVEGYRHGQNAPLPFFPNTAWAFAAAEHAGEEPGSAAQRAWEGNTFQGFQGEGANAWVATAWRGGRPLDAPFYTWARRLLMPLFQHRRFTEPGDADA